MLPAGGFAAGADSKIISSVAENGMRDVVGTSCVLCHQRIEGIFEGVFCPECGGPYHHSCFGGSQREQSSSHCFYCNGDVSDPQAVQFRDDRERALHGPHQDDLTPKKTIRMRPIILGFFSTIIGLGLARLVNDRNEAESDFRELALGISLIGVVGWILVRAFWPKIL